MKAAIISLGGISSRWTATAMENYFDEVDSLDIEKEGKFYQQRHHQSR